MPKQMNPPQVLHNDKLRCVRHGWRIEKWQEKGRKSLHWAIVSPDGLRLTSADTRRRVLLLADEVHRFIGPVDALGAEEIIAKLRAARLTHYVRDSRHDYHDGLTVEWWHANTLNSYLEPYPEPIRLA